MLMGNYLKLMKAHLNCDVMAGTTASALHFQPASPSQKVIFFST
jgi:hypothetical protein